jgi:OOP family OmpA-OmpF porin
VKLEVALTTRFGVQGMLGGFVVQDGRSPDPALRIADPPAGGMFMAGGGIRFRPLNDQSGYAVHLGSASHHRGNLFGNLWIDADIGYVRTGSRNRLGFDAGLGLELSVIDGIQLGPFIKYVQILETSSQLQPEDARIAMAGISASVGGPSVHLSDRDGDGIPDELDRCPERREDADGFQDQDGCPDRDNDRDGIVDSRDHCPVAPEDDDGFEDDDGCPEEGPEEPSVPTPRFEEREVEVDELLEQRVLFDTGKARVRTRYRPFVREVEALLSEHPEILRIRIEGHADERGTDAYNDWLSTERARRAAAVLRRYGIDRSRVDFIGYGRRQPAVPGRTLHALRQNRRVRFRIVLVRRRVDVSSEEVNP